MGWLKKNWFMPGIVAAVAMGLAAPSLATLNPESITSNVIVILLFLGIGFTLPSEAIVSGLKNLKLHLYVQLFIFVVTPLYFLLSSSFFSFSPEIRIGIFALAALPTTISTCIVFTQSAGGNVVGTMFNAALSNIAGVVLSPVILSLLLRETGRAMPMEVLAGIVLSLAWKMILPMGIGQLLHLRFSGERSGDKSARYNAKKIISTASNVLIMLLVTLSMAKSASAPGFFTRLSSMGWVLLYLALSHYVVIALALGGGKLFGFSSGDRISIAYAAPQKTLAMGVPLLGAYFAGEPELLGVVLLPLVFYHPWQIINAGFLKALPLMRAVGKDSSVG